MTTTSTQAEIEIRELWSNGQQLHAAKDPDGAILLCSRTTL